MASFEINLASPRGFCAGVDRAIEIVNRALEQFGAPVYVRHEVVHNKHVVEDLTARGAVFVEEVDEIPAKTFTENGKKYARSGDGTVYDLSTEDQDEVGTWDEIEQKIVFINTNL